MLDTCIKRIPLYAHHWVGDSDALWIFFGVWGEAGGGGGGVGVGWTGVTKTGT